MNVCTCKSYEEYSMNEIKKQNGEERIDDEHLATDILSNNLIMMT